MSARTPVYEHCLGCGEDIEPCKAPDACVLLGWRHVGNGFHSCPTVVGAPLFARPVSDEAARAVKR